jgi:hypothetical protein
MATYMGVGTIIGAGSNRFLRSAIEGSQDKFGIKIQDQNNGNGIVYDNLLKAPDEANPTTVIGGGNLLVH